MVGSSECWLEEQKTQEMLDMPENLKKQIVRTLQPMAEKWAGVKLIFSMLYGIRRYSRGAWLGGHLDQPSEY